MTRITRTKRTFVGCAAVLLLATVSTPLLFAGERYTISKPYDQSSRRNVRQIGDHQYIVTDPMNKADREVINVRKGFQPYKQRPIHSQPMHAPVNPRPSRNR